MKLRDFLETRRFWFINYVILLVAIGGFIVAMCAGEQAESEPEPGPDSTYTRTEYGIWSNDAVLLYLGTPEEMGIVWGVVFALEGSGPVYRYFEAETDAWTFYSMLRMTLAGGKDHE